MSLRTFLAFVLVTVSGSLGAANNYIAANHFELNDNGAWSWFMDERAIIDQGRLIVGSVRANGRFEHDHLPGWGNVELAILDLKTSENKRLVLHEHFEQDDHNNPGLLVLPDGHYLAMYSRHGRETKFYYRISTEPRNPYHWSPAREFITPGNAGNFRGDSVTYANPIYLSAEKRLYLFHRSVGLDPNYLVSEDHGRTWRYGGRLFIGRDGYSPYVKYTSNGRDTIHLVATEDHPRNFDNSLYHAFIRGGTIHTSEGKPIGPLATSTNTELRPWNFTTVFAGSRTNVAWMTDIQVDSNGRPVVLFTTQRDGAGQPVGAGGMDHRFNYARWDGTNWISSEVAYAGTRLYPGEDDYTGLGAIDPRDPSVIYISTDAHPERGTPLISRASLHRFHELYVGRTGDGGKTWRWKELTANSTTDNLRPIVPLYEDRPIVCWLRGAYRNNRGEWSTQVMATILPASDLP